MRRMPWNLKDSKRPPDLGAPAGQRKKEEEQEEEDISRFNEKKEEGEEEEKEDEFEYRYGRGEDEDEKMLRCRGGLSHSSLMRPGARETSRTLDQRVFF
eukprot:9504103-Pyramimonas_sp.AAC.2